MRVINVFVRRLSHIKNCRLQSTFLLKYTLLYRQVGHEKLSFSKVGRVPKSLRSIALMTSIDTFRTATIITEHYIAKIIYIPLLQAIGTRSLSRCLYYLIKTFAYTIRMIWLHEERLLDLRVCLLLAQRKQSVKWSRSLILSFYSYIRRIFQIA